MRLKSLVSLFLLCLCWGRFASAQVSEKERLEGFAQHYKDQERFDEARRKGERAYFEEEAQWESQKQRRLDEYKKQKEAVKVTEDGAAAKEDAQLKSRLAREYEGSRQEYIQNKSKLKIVDRKSAHLPSEGQELGLDRERPRYDYRKRASYGGKPKYGQLSRGSGSGSSGPSSGGSSFPPPPTFDDFGGGGGGYVPAPSFPEDFGDVPPPPPPPIPSGFGDDFGGGSDFPPPPPPPPSPFGDDGGF